MKKLIVNEKLSISIGDGFHEMTADEISALNTIAEGDFVALSDTDRHMIITVGWKEIGGFASMLLNSKDIAKNMEKSIRKALMINSYALGRFKERDIVGKKAFGFDYSYEVQGIVMIGESYALKVDKTIYYFHMYSRQTYVSENMKIWEEFTGSIRFEAR